MTKNGKLRMSGTLNTIWHGTFAFVVRSEGIEILIPKVDMHAYYAGNWGHELQELSLGKRYRLEGIKSGDGTAKFNQDEHVYVRGPLVPHYDRFLRCSWGPLVPKNIFTLQRMQLDRNNFGQPIPATVQIPNRLGLLHVMTFEFDDLSSLCVLEEAADGSRDQRSVKLPWRPMSVPNEVLGGTGQKCIVNLHIFSDPPHSFDGSMARMDYEHPTAAFGDLMRLTQVPELSFRYTKGEEPIMLPDASVPPGLRRSEMMSLAESGLLNGHHLPSTQHNPTHSSAAVGAGATAWVLSDRTVSLSALGNRSDASRRAFLHRAGACALLGGALSKRALGFQKPINCSPIVVCC